MLWSRLNKALIFVPWLSFIGQGAFNLPDYTNLKIGIGKNCKTPQKTFQVKTVTTPAALKKGLSNRYDDLKKNEGMLFIFNPARPAEFWMKDTFIPLQIGFFDEKGKLIKKHHMSIEKNPAQPVARYGTTKKVSTALEVAPGALDELKTNEAQLCIEKK